jgi:hypothetical protein
MFFIENTRQDSTDRQADQDQVLHPPVVWTWSIDCARLPQGRAIKVQRNRVIDQRETGRFLPRARFGSSDGHCTM